MAAAKERGCFVELNAHPMRLDLDDQHCRLAKERGVLVSIGTDAHSVDGLGFIRASAAWLARKRRRAEYSPVE
jgi:DNA polymerase (family X)